MTDKNLSVSLCFIFRYKTTYMLTTTARTLSGWATSRRSTNTGIRRLFNPSDVYHVQLISPNTSKLPSSLPTWHHLRLKVKTSPSCFVLSELIPIQCPQTLQ
jgi:hypothetical protein